uniref:Uncharacterized protein n=1 Tax=Arundo donax TaxID=35708 RepID=A0A0A9BBX3_ARUDO
MIQDPHSVQTKLGIAAKEDPRSAQPLFPYIRADRSSTDPPPSSPIATTRSIIQLSPRQ